MHTLTRLLLPLSIIEHFAGVAMALRTPDISGFFPSEILPLFWNGPLLAAVSILVMVATIFLVAAWDALKDLLKDWFKRIISATPSLFWLCLLSGAFLLAFLGSGRWRSAIAVIVLGLILFLVNKHFRLRIRRMLLIIVVVALSSSVIETVFFDPRGQVRVYVVLPFTPRNPDDAESLLRISESFRGTLTTVFHDLPLHIEIEPASFNDPVALKNWAESDATRADALLQNEASLSPISDSETVLVMLTQLKCLRSQKEVEFSEQGLHSQAPYLFLDATMKLLENLRTLPQLSLSRLADMAIKKNIVRKYRQLMILDGQATRDQINQIDALLAAPTMDDKTIRALIQSHITPVDRARLVSYRDRQATSGLAKIGL